MISGNGGSPGSNDRPVAEDEAVPLADVGVVRTAMVVTCSPGGGVSVVMRPEISGEPAMFVAISPGVAGTPSQRHSKTYSRPGSRPSTVTRWNPVSDSDVAATGSSGMPGRIHEPAGPGIAAEPTGAAATAGSSAGAMATSPSVGTVGRSGP